MDETFWKAMAATIARKIMFGIATYLTTKGLLASGDQGQFINMGVGILIGAAALAWDWWKNVGHAKLHARVAAMQGVAKQQAQAPSGPNVARVLVPLAILVLGLSLLASPALAQDRGAGAPIRLPIPLPHIAQPAAAANAGDQLGQLLAKPFQDLANFIANDLSAAITLSTAIPALQDGHGQQCFMAMQAFGDVVKAHPIPVTFRAATDLEALRLAQIAANNLCGNPHCTQVFADLATTVQTAAPINVSIPIPSLHDLCSKVPQIAVVAPVAATTPNTPVPTLAKP